MANQEFTTEELENEIWRDVVGYAGIYSVSALGRVRSDLTRGHWRAGRILSAGKGSHGYLVVALCLNRAQKMVLVHHLVAGAFIGTRPYKAEVNHLDGVKTNNRVTNLEYCTRSQNALHAHRSGLTNPVYGERSGRAKLKDSDIPQIFFLRSLGLTQEKIGQMVGVSGSHIGEILAGKARNR